MKWPSNHKLVLLPGLDGTGLMFEPFKNVFPNLEQLQIISYPVDQKLNYDELLEIVKKQLPKSQKFILLAESFSGPLAAKLLDHPNLHAAIFCASFVKSPRPFISKIMNYLPTSLLFKISLPSLILRFACLGYKCPASTVDFTKISIQKVNSEVLAFRFGLLRKIDELNYVAKSHKPILCLVPSKDKLVPLSCSEDIKKANNSVYIEKIKGAHFLLQSSPEESVRAICEFSQNL